MSSDSSYSGELDSSEKLPDWKVFDMPPVPQPDDTQIEAQLNQRYDISTLFQQMRATT